MLSPKDMLRSSVLAFSVAALVGCSGSSTNHTLGEFNAKTVGATCTMVDSSGAEVSGVTESSGMVSVHSNLAKGLVTMTCTGGTYVDEATGATVNAPTLRVGTNYTGGSLTLIASPLTEIAYALAIAAGGTANMASYNAKVATAFGLDGTDIVGTVPQDLNDSAVDDSDAGKMGLVLAAIAQMGADAGTDPATTIGNLVADIRPDDAIKAGTVSTAIDNLQASGRGASSNAAGSTDAETAITGTGGGGLAAPALADATTQTYTTGTAITALDLTNSGGAVASCSSNPALPVGLSVMVNGSTCQISGTPTAVTAAADYTITGTNATGSSTATVNITVGDSLVAPALADAVAQTYTTGTAITALDLANSGGAVASCSSSPALPAGLSVAVNGSTCQISGTPTAATAAADYTITGTNATGSDTATVNITVNADVTNVDMSAPTVVAGTNNKVALTLSGNANGAFAVGDFAIASSNAQTAPTISSIEFTDGTSSLALVMDRNIASASAGSVAESFTVAFTKGSSTANVNDMAATAIMNNSDNQNCSDCVLDSNGCPF